MKSKVKICGITNADDAKLAIDEGADYIGLIFAPSKRQVIKGQVKIITDAFPGFKNWVAVFMDGKKKEIESVLEGLPIKLIQFHGKETPSFCNYFVKRGYDVIKAIPVSERGVEINPSDYKKVAFFLFDTVVNGQSGGTGKVFSWDIFKNLNLDKEQIILSGGLTADNILAAVEQVQPYCVDVSSGVESVPGKKDKAKIKELFKKLNNE